MRYWQSVILLGLCFSLQNVSQALAVESFISVCSGAPPSGATQITHYESFTSERAQTLFVSPNRPAPSEDCITVKLSVEAQSIKWTGLIPEEQAGLLSKGIVLMQEPGSDKPPEIETLAEKTIVTSNKPKYISTLPAESLKPFAPRVQAAWAWDPEFWQHAPQAMLKTLQTNAIHRVYITVPVQEDAALPDDTAVLKTFIQQAHAQNTEVWAVEGDPSAVLSQPRQEFIQRARVYRHYNQSVSPSQRLTGIQYDIEPYLVSGYTIQPERAHQAYLETLTQLHAASRLPLDIAVPFWFSDAELPAGTLLLDALAPVIQRVTVMDYRTEPELLLEFANPFLAWGDVQHREVSIAVESGPLPDQARRVYRPAPVGELWHVPIGSYQALILTDTLGKNPWGENFAYSHQTLFKSDKLTFHNNKAHLRQIVPQLNTMFNPWPSFVGLSFHELLTFTTSPE